MCVILHIQALKWVDLSMNCKRNVCSRF
uniref:Uncharacterized protein n=1 Tax=Anguilla anguilla TaxID=7936 RepID=A0A0E9S8W8_ANGAN